MIWVSASRSHSSSLDHLKNPIYWLDTRTSTAASKFSAQQIMDVVLNDLRPEQRSMVRQVNDDSELGLACPQAFNGLSSCFGAVDFSDISNDGSVTYVLRLDLVYNRVKVSTNSGDAETRTLHYNTLSMRQFFNSTALRLRLILSRLSNSLTVNKRIRAG